MRWVAVVLVVVMAATPALASAQPVEPVEQTEKVETSEFQLKRVLSVVVWGTLLLFGQNIMWELYKDTIMQGVRSSIGLAREKWDRYVAVLFVKTGRVCRLARASDGEWVALCEE